MKDNILTKISQSISANLSDDEITSKIQSLLQDTDEIYSYIVYAKSKNDKFLGWIVEYNFSQNNKFNTLKRDAVIESVTNTVINSRNSEKPVVGYKQPCIELMLQLYKPLMQKLVLEQCERWKELEYEDAMSMCQFTMAKLYIKGYYIHKRLLKRSFENYVLMELRHNKNKPEILSFNQVMHGDGENGDITLADMLPDRDAEIEAERKEEEQVFQAIFEEVKAMIIEFIGERQFDQLLRDYGNKHTTPWSCKKMRQIKDKFKKRGITLKSFGGDL